VRRASPRHPTGPVRLIEPFGPGGAVDVLVRPVAAQLSELWDQPVTVENHPGCGATAAPALVAKAPADGHTLLVNTSAHTYSAGIATDLPYDPLADFVPVAPLTRQAYVLVAGRAAGVRSLDELLAAAKAKRGGLKFSSAGVGTGTHLAAETLKVAAGLSATHVPPQPTDAIADAIARTAAGETDFAVSPITIAVSHLRAGDLVALGTTSARRSTLLPDVPTIAEAGIAGFDFPVWYGVWAPAGTPARTVEALSEDIATALAAPGLREWLDGHGAEPMEMSPPEFARFVLDESARAARMVLA
jgi:tripartite-type tricarboxylate transporter receptor subunit TctC